MMSVMSVSSVGDELEHHPLDIVGPLTRFEEGPVVRR